MDWLNWVETGSSALIELRSIETQRLEKNTEWFSVGLIKDESFHFFWPKFRRNFGFRWPAIRKRGAKCRWEKFRQISVKIGEKIAEKWVQAKNRRNLQKIAGHCNLSANFRFVSPIFFRFFGKFPDISYQSSPRRGYKIWSWFAGKDCVF